MNSLLFFPSLSRFAVFVIDFLSCYVLIYNLLLSYVLLFSSLVLPFFFIIDFLSSLVCWFITLSCLLAYLFTAAPHVLHFLITNSPGCYFHLFAVDFTSLDLVLTCVVAHLYHDRFSSPVSSLTSSWSWLPVPVFYGLGRSSGFSYLSCGWFVACLAVLIISDLPLLVVRLISYSAPRSGPAGGYKLADFAFYPFWHLRSELMVTLCTIQSL